MKVRLSALWMLAFAFAILASWGNVARAAPTDAILTWTVPTQNSDGTPLTNLAGYVLSYSTDPAVPSTGANFATVTITNPALTTYTVSGLAAGTWYFAMRSTNAKGDFSERTSIASVVLSGSTNPPPKTIPKPPGDLKVTTPSVPNTAFSVIKSQEQLVLLPVGTVPADTSCDASQAVVKNGVTFYVVPTSAVTYSGSARPVVVLAACSGTG